jgi:hypothetical protein
MSAPSSQVRLVIDASPDTDLEELASLTQQLRAELLDLDVEEVEVPRTEVTADHTKAGDVFTWGTILVSLGGAIDLLPAVVGLVQNWLARRQQHSVTMEINGNKIELTGVSSDQVQQFVDLWMARYPPSER